MNNLTLTREPDDGLALVWPRKLGALAVHVELPTARQVELDKLHIDTERIFTLTVGQR